MVPQVGFEPTRHNGHGLLRTARLPIPSPGHYLVQPTGIEPVSMALQTTAMTTSAKVALVPETGLEPVSLSL